MSDERGSLVGGKPALRRRMRTVRRSVIDRESRSRRIVGHLQQLDELRSASYVLLYRAVGGEVEIAGLGRWCRAHGTVVVVPESHRDASLPDDPRAIDVAVVPGLAFTAAGDRLGQGIGWYDRLLPLLRPDALTIGVCFDVQVVDHLPVEPHDVRLDLVVTESGVVTIGT